MVSQKNQELFSLSEKTNLEINKLKEDLNLNHNEIEKIYFRFKIVFPELSYDKIDDPNKILSSTELLDNIMFYIMKLETKLREITISTHNL